MLDLSESDLCRVEKVWEKLVEEAQVKIADPILGNYHVTAYTDAAQFLIKSETFDEMQ